MNVSEQLSAQLMDKGRTRLTIPQPHPHVQKAPLLFIESSAMRCDVTCLWALATGANMSVALGWAQLLGIRWGHRWCFPPKAEALLPTTCGTQRHHHVGRGAHWPAVRLNVVVLWFIMKTLNYFQIKLGAFKCLSYWSLKIQKKCLWKD